MRMPNKIQEKIVKYHEIMRTGGDTTSIKAEIDAYTKQYIEELNTTLNQIRADKHVIEQKEVSHEVIDKTDYRTLIELYRKSKDIALEISLYKKHLRTIMGGVADENN
jgi:hypothetical protein